MAAAAGHAPGISWDDEKAHLGFHPAALVDDVANVLLDCACVLLFTMTKLHAFALTRLCGVGCARRPVHGAGPRGG